MGAGETVYFVILAISSAIVVRSNCITTVFQRPGMLPSIIELKGEVFSYMLYAATIVGDASVVVRSNCVFDI